MNRVILVIITVMSSVTLCGFEQDQKPKKYAVMGCGTDFKKIVLLITYNNGDTFSKTVKSVNNPPVYILIDEIKKIQVIDAEFSDQAAEGNSFKVEQEVLDNIFADLKEGLSAPSNFSRNASKKPSKGVVVDF